MNDKKQKPSVYFITIKENRTKKNKKKNTKKNKKDKIFLKMNKILISSQEINIRIDSEVSNNNKKEIINNQILPQNNNNAIIFGKFIYI